MPAHTSPPSSRFPLIPRPTGGGAHLSQSPHTIATGACVILPFAHRESCVGDEDQEQAALNAAADALRGASGLFSGALLSLPFWALVLWVVLP